MYPPATTIAALLALLTSGAMADPVPNIAISTDLSAPTTLSDAPAPSGGWDRLLPSTEFSGIAVSGTDLFSAWKSMVSATFLRCNLYVVHPAPPGAFSLDDAPRTGAEMLDALATHYGYRWEHDAETGVIWVFPADIELDDILPESVEVKADLIAAPMHSGIVAPLREALPWGALLTQGWSDLWLSTFDYPVGLKAGTYTVRDILNQCCLWSPKQAFVAMKDPTGVNLMDVHLPFDTYPSPAPGAVLFWETEVGPLPGGETPSAEYIGSALRAADAHERWAARAYLSMCLESRAAIGLMTRRLPSLAPDDGAAWEALGVAAAQSQRPDKFPVNEEALTALNKLATAEAISALSPETALLVVLSVVAYGGDEAVLTRPLRIDGLDVASIVFDLVRLANFSEPVSRALFDSASPAYLGDRLVGPPRMSVGSFQRLQVVAATTEARSES